MQAKKDMDLLENLKTMANDVYELTIYSKSIKPKKRILQ